jgi:hypothetical protein
MSQLSRKLRSASNGGLMFWCAGCDTPHRVGVGGGDGPQWTWNGDVDRPTFSPSVLVTWTTAVPPATTLENSEQIRRGEIVQQEVPQVCHSFVTDGRIQYLSDCTHAMAGQTIELADWAEWWDR